VSSRCGTTNNAQARPLGVASRAAELRGGLWRAAVGKTGRLTVEWGTTAEHTEWGACAEHARLQLNDNDKLKDNGLGFILFVGFSFSRTEIFSTEILSDWISVAKPGGILEVYWKLQGAS
jgi:hypothetical protein